MDTLIGANLVWVMLSAALVLFMQAGFCLLESGMARSKNSINVAVKNLVDLCVCGILFWAIGFGLMFGRSAGGWIGCDGFGLAGYQHSSSLAFFLFQFVFCGTATTIISGAAAERMSFLAYIVVAIIVSGIFFPVFGHWAWGGKLGGTPGWLAAMGFVDFAGSTVVHSIGGWISLSAILVLGPRLGRFTNGSSHVSTRSHGNIQGHDLGLATVGVFVLWFGWFGFNGGSTLVIDSRVPLILVNTNLAAAAGGLSSLAISWVYEGRPSVTQLLVGVIAGLVAITAGCHLVSPWSSIVIGGIGGGAACGTVYVLAKLRIDDVVGAFPTHAIAGVWGTLALALLAPPSALPTGDRLTQFGVQLIGVVVAFVWAFGGSLVLFLGLGRVMRLRVTRRNEHLGLNYSEHGASTAMIDLAIEMHRHGLKRQFNRPVAIDRHTEAGQIGKAYNRVLKEVSAEISLRSEAERRYRDIVENAIEGIFQTTPDGFFQSANPALLELYGDRTIEALQARTPSLASNLYVDPKRRDEFVRMISEKGILRDFRSQVRRADGSCIWISESARAVKNEAGKLLYYEGTVVDITDRIDAERLHRERDFAAAANEAKSQFLARMSHEMRTPLGGVINTLDLITDDMPSTQRSRFIEIAKESAHSLLTLINDVLDLSRIEAGKLDIEAIETDLEKTVRIASEMLYHSARKKGLRLASRVSQDLPSKVWLDGTRLQQIIVNLIGNAVKFTTSGEITVSVSRVSRDEATIQPDDEDAIVIRVEVADTGIGVARDRMEKIFEVFTQADRSTTRRYGGSGLGLAICRQLVELMGGKIGVKAREVRGTVFWFEIPATPGLSSSERGTDPLSGQQVVVYAPDHAETDVTIKNLKSWGIVVTHCRTIDEVRAISFESPQNGSDFRLALVDSEFQDQWLEALAGLQLGRLSMLPVTWLGAPKVSAATDRFLDRPIHASALFDEILTVLMLRTASDVALPALVDSPIGKGQSVLIVDDNEVNRIVASEMIRRLGFEVHAVESGRDAIDELVRRDIGIVLMDCEMPEMDGLEATGRIRSLHHQNKLARTSYLPVTIIACTAQAVGDDRQRCIDAGMDHYLTKPIGREELKATLQRALQAAPPIQYEELLVRCGDDKQVAEEVLRAFSRRGAEDIRRVVAAVAVGKEKTSAAVHRIKGAASTLAAHRLSQLAESIEETVRRDQPHREQDYAHSVKELESEMNRCIQWIEALLEST